MKQSSIARSKRIFVAFALCAACGSDPPGSSATPAGSLRPSPKSGMPASALGGGGAAGGADTGGSIAGGSGSAQAGSAAASPEPTFTYIYGQLFRSCVIAPCHGSAVAGVDMSSQANAYASLVNRPPQPMGECEPIGLMRVVPFEPDQSLLTAKLEIDAPCGQQMPIGGLLPDDQRALIRTWIMNGALDD